MKKSIAIILIILALVAGGVVGYALHGTQAPAPSTTTPGSTQPTSNNAQDTQSSNDSNTTTKCTTATLSASVAAAEGGAAAGNRYYDLTLTNTSSKNCTVNGYPGVSLVDASGTIVGSPAEKDTSKAATAITLAPSQSAMATLHTTVSDNYPSGICREGATTIKVYPPDDTNSLTVSNSPIIEWCPGFSTTVFVKS